MMTDALLREISERAGACFRALAAPLERRGMIRAMSPELRGAFDREMQRAEDALARGDEATAMHHFGRAHLLGSYFCFSHFSSHMGMLRIGLRRRDWREARVQVLRTAGTIGTRLLVPFIGVTGNPGSADRPIGARYSLPPDIAEVLARQAFPVRGEKARGATQAVFTSSRSDAARKPHPAGP